MNCFPCFQFGKSQSENDLDNVPVAQPKGVVGSTTHDVHPSQQRPSTDRGKDDGKPIDSENIDAKNFTFRELATATKHFRQECLLGEGGFGRVFRGTLPASGQVVAVKQLDKNSTQGSKEFLVEVLMLSLLHHPNLLNMVGYCADGDQRLLVYEYMPRGSLEEHLLGLKQEGKPLDWVTRMKIASGVAQGLEYLHEKANPPIIYRDLKCSNVMLDDQFNPKLADYGLAKLGGNKGSHVSPSILGSYGYCAPEYEMHGELTLKSDVYSFGVILLELISGRRAVDTSRPAEEQNLVKWVQPIFRDPKRFPEMADPLLKNEYPEKSLNQAVGIAAMCLQDEPEVRPLISDVVVTLSFLSVPQPEPVPAPLQAPIPPSGMEAPSRKESRRDRMDGDLSDNSGNSSEYSDSDGEESNAIQQEPPKNSNHEESNSFQLNRGDDQSGSDSESGASSASSDREDNGNVTHQERTAEKERQQVKAESSKYSSFGNQEMEYEVASMSSSSDSSLSDYESQQGSFSRKYSSNGEVQHGNSSVKLSRKSTKKSQEGSSARSSSRGNSRRGSVRLSSKRSSNVELDSGSAGSSTRQKSSSMRSENGSMESYSRLSSNARSKNGSASSAHRASYSRNSSKAGYENVSARSAHDSDSDSDDSEEEIL